MAEVSFSITGDPASQGSHAIMQGRIVQVNSKKHKAWRTAIVTKVIETLPQDWVPIDGPCELNVLFLMPRGKTVSRGLPTVAPDL
jgi:hypothetical protein